jgi:hypothetical protein
MVTNDRTPGSSSTAQQLRTALAGLRVGLYAQHNVSSVEKRLILVAPSLLKDAATECHCHMMVAALNSHNSNRLSWL